MGKLILVTGGARSGKSSYAESIASNLEGEILYLATAVPFDDEMKNIIQKHKEKRPKGWTVYEGYKGLGKVIENEGTKYKGILLDCITVMVTNLLFERQDISFENPVLEYFEKAENDIKVELEYIISAARNIATTQSNETTLIMVTNEIGSGIVPENMLARIFRDIAGRMNQYAAQQSDDVYLIVCGIPVKIK